MTEFLTQQCEKYPVVKEIVNKYGDLSLKEYVLSQKHCSVPDIMPSKDFYDSVREQVAYLFDGETAEKTVNLLQRTRCISTSNHHHIASYLPDVQGSILYDYWLQINNEKDGIVPLFPSTGIHLSGTSYAQGLYINHCNSADRPIKTHWIPNKFKGCCVATMQGFIPQHIDRAKINFCKLRDGEIISEEMYYSLIEFCENVLLSEKVQNTPLFVDQITLVNEMLSRRYFVDRTPRYIWINSGKITSDLLLKDIQKTNSIPYKILFDYEICKKIINELDGVDCCWTGNKIGTHYFWGIDEKNIRYPLFLDEENGKAILIGKTRRGEGKKFDLTPECITKEILNNRLLPCVFLDFLECNFLRDFSPIGGRRQHTYLQQMIKGIINTFEHFNIFKNEIEILRQKKDITMHGMAFLVRNDKNGTYPLSSAELLEKPINSDEFEFLINQTLEKSFNSF